MAGAKEKTSAAWTFFLSAQTKTCYTELRTIQREVAAILAYGLPAATNIHVGTVNRLTQGTFVCHLLELMSLGYYTELNTRVS